MKNEVLQDFAHFADISWTVSGNLLQSMADCDQSENCDQLTSQPVIRASRMCTTL